MTARLVLSQGKQFLILKPLHQRIVGHPVRRREISAFPRSFRTTADGRSRKFECISQIAIPGLEEQSSQSLSCLAYGYGPVARTVRLPTKPASKTRKLTDHFVDG